MIGEKRVASAGRARTASLESDLERQLAKAPKGVKPSKVLALAPRPGNFGRALLYWLLRSAKESGERAALALEMLAHLRRMLPAAFERIPLRVKDFGFRTVEECAQFLTERLAALGTRAKSLRAFSREKSLRGLRWQIVGKVMFERLIKYHKAFNAFVLDWADAFRRLVNTEIRDRGFTWMVDVNDVRRKIVAPFRTPKRVLEFKLEGGADVRPEFTDWGTMAVNAHDQVLLTPVEIKLPAALQGVTGQIASFKERLSAAKKLIAVVENADGTRSEVPIDKDRIVFSEESSHHIVITLYNTRRWERGGLSATDKSGKRLLDVEPIAELKPIHNPQTNTVFYGMRVTVNRDWLVELVKVVTDPAPR